MIQPTITRDWARPNRDTFSCRPIREFVARWSDGRGPSVDPFARNCRLADATNDINPLTEAEHHMDARDFLRLMGLNGRRFGLAYFDPPYSSRQAAECYRSIGRKPTMTDTQNARLYRECRELIGALAVPGCVVLSFGWNSVGMPRPWVKREILIVCHGSAHHDTICVADELSV